MQPGVMTPEVISLSLWQTAIRDEHDRNSNHFSLPLMQNDYNKCPHHYEQKSTKLKVKFCSRSVQIKMNIY